MKKALVLLLALSLVGGLMFAQAGITASGSFKAMWGVDWDEATTGFDSALDGIQLKFTLPTTDGGIAKKTGSEGSTTYGEISIDGLKVYAETPWNTPDISGKFDKSLSYLRIMWGSLSAKVVIGQLTVQLKGGASSSINYAGAKVDSYWLQNAFDYHVYSKRYGSDEDAQDGALAKLDETWNTVWFDVDVANYGWDFSFAQNYGIVLKYSVPSVVDVALDVASYKKWSDDTRYDQNDATNLGDNAYVGRFTASVTAVPNLTAQAGISVGWLNPVPAVNEKQELGFIYGGKIAYAVKVGETITITPQVAVDLKEAYSDYQIFAAGGINADLMGAKFVVNAGFANRDAVTHDWSNGTMATDLSACAVTVSADSGSLVPNLTLQAAFEWQDPLWNFRNDETYAFYSKLGYDIAVNEAVKVTPWVKGSFDNKDDTTKAAKTGVDTIDAYTKAGVDVTGLIQNVTLSTEWDSNDLIQEGVHNPLKLGQLFITCKVSF